MKHQGENCVHKAHIMTNWRSKQKKSSAFTSLRNWYLRWQLVCVGNLDRLLIVLIDFKIAKQEPAEYLKSSLKEWHR